VKIQNKLLFAISIVSIVIVVFQLWSTIPNIGEYASDAHLFETLEEGNVWADWVLEARENLIEVPINLILNVCFFALVAFWSFSGSLETEKQTPAKPETTN
jgi:ABC-type sulfate transport system permease subunit